MRFRVFPTLVAQCLLLLALLPAATLSQDRPTQDRPTPGGLAPVKDLRLDVNAVLRQGRELEQKRRWDDALTHYEDALKRFPGDATLKRRYHFARMHYDVGRRYADSSFRQMAGDLSLRDALALYREVLLKVDTHYVDRPDWKEVVDHGTNMFDVALTDEAFVKKQLAGVSADQIEQFRISLRRTMTPASIRSRKGAYDAVHWAAYDANKQLGLSATAAVLEYACGAANSLDDYSAFLSSGELKELYAQIRGNFVGLGIELKANDNGLLILRVIHDSPAETAGLRPRDLIVGVDGRRTQDMSADQAADLLQGPEGSQVQVTIESPGKPPRTVNVRRAKVDVPSVDELKILDKDNGIAYFRLSSFQETTQTEVNDALWKLHRQGMKSLIVDVRGNPGGLLKAAVDVVDYFVADGTIVYTRGRNGQENQTYRAQKSERWTWHVPLVVLIDEDSASASEIFAGAIRDHGRGIVVGRRSYGKGSVQGIFSLDTGSTGIRLTTAKFYSPKGKPYSKVGVEPNVLVRRANRPIEERLFAEPTADDPDIAAALDEARKRLAQRRR